MKKQNGITLIALIITIIVMLILVGVSVTVALNGGLFTTAQDAANNTRAERDNELAISNGDIIDQYLSGTGNGSETATEYTIGDEITVGGENFFVIGETTDTVTLLAKYNLKADGENWIQDTEGNSNPCVFSAAGGFTTDENLNNNSTVKVDTTSAVHKAMLYGEQFEIEGITGRLMTYGEAKPLSESEDEKILKMLYGIYSEGTSLNYWLGSAIADDAVYVTRGHAEMITGLGYDQSDVMGVRPVIEIPKSAIQ